MRRVALLGGAGYIGSALHPVLEEAGLEVTAIDSAAPLPGVARGAAIRRDYRDLGAGELERFDAIVLLAGHSSVGLATRDPHGAWHNNVTGFVDLLQKLRGQRLLYASSSSVYTGSGGDALDESQVTHRFENVYDFTKFSTDQCSALMYPDAVGLRFGTVCGPSPNLRTDVMLNRMVLTAMRDGVVRIANPRIHRPILGIRDLCGAVLAVLASPGLRGPCNLASFSGTVEEFGGEVARLTGARIEMLPPTPTYDFSMSTDRFSRKTGFRFAQTLEQLVAELGACYRQRGLHESGR